MSAIGSTANANGATLTGTILNLEPADASFGGVVTTGTQTFAGAKTMTTPTFVTNATVPLVIGGTTTTSTLTLQSTSGVGTTLSDIIFKDDNTEFMRILNSGNVGIGTAAPTEKFHVVDARTTASSIASYVQKTGAVVGTSYGSFINLSGASTANVGLYLTASGATSNYALVVPSTGGNVGIGTTSPTEKFHIQDTRSTANSIGMYVVKPIAVVGISYGSYVATSGASTTNIGGYFTASGATNNYALIVPSTGGSVGIGTATPLTKLQIETSSTSTTLGSDFAQFPILLKNTSATDNNFTNILFRNSGATAIASMGVQVTSHASSTADILFATRGATFSEKMRITSAGNVGIGTATPTAVLHLKAGTATASTAPLKLTSGTNNTTAEAGAFEFDGTSLFFTNTGNIRQQLAQVQNTRVVTTDFTVTSSTTLVAVTGLTATVAAGKTYFFRAELYTLSQASAGGVNVSISGVTTTATAIRYDGIIFPNGVAPVVSTFAALGGSPGVFSTTAVDPHITVTGTITVGTGGTLTVMFAQATSNVLGSAVRIGSTFQVTQIQ